MKLNTTGRKLFTQEGNKFNAPLFIRAKYLYFDGMKRLRTPQEKKMLSYQRDGRSDYGENDKASCKAIPFRKRWVNKTYRQAVRQTIASNLPLLQDDPTYINDAVKSVKRKRWKKSPDKRLGDYLRDKAAFREKYGR